MEGLEVIRLFSDSKEKFSELRTLVKMQKETDQSQLKALKVWFEGEGKSVEQLLVQENLKFTERLMLEKLGKDFHEAIKKIDKVTK